MSPQPQCEPSRRNANEVVPNFKKPKRKSPKKLSQTKVCDMLFSKVIRSRGSCQHCAKTVELQCAHGFSRRYRAVRWDERNAFCLCKGCHLYFTVRPLEWDDWLVDRWGVEQYRLLRGMAMSCPNPPLKDVAARLRERVARLGIAA